MAVFRHLKCCDGWVFFVFLYSRWGLKCWVSCLLKWKRDRGSILRCRTVGEEKEKILLSSRKRKREKYCWSSEKSFSGFGVGRFLLTLEIFWFADDCSSYIINVLSFMFKILFDSGEVLEPFSLDCKVDVVDYVVEVCDAGIDDSSVERWLLLYWKPCRILGAELRVGTRSFIFFRRRNVVWEEK